MKTIEIIDIAEIENLNYIETTTGINGYPQNLKFALTGFENFEHAQEIADKYNLRVESFMKKYGWELWSRNNNWMYEPYKLDVDNDFGDNYSEVDEDLVRQEIKDNIDNIDPDEVVDWLKNRAELIEFCQDAEEDEVVVTYYGEYFDTFKRESMSFSHDTRNYIIGVI